MERGSECIGGSCPFGADHGEAELHAVLRIGGEARQVAGEAREGGGWDVFILCGPDIRGGGESGGGVDERGGAHGGGGEDGPESAVGGGDVADADFVGGDGIHDACERDGLAANGASLRDGVACGVIRSLVGACKAHAKHPADRGVSASGTAHRDTEGVSGIECSSRRKRAIPSIPEVEICNSCDSPIAAGLVGSGVARVAKEEAQAAFCESWADITATERECRAVFRVKRIDLHAACGLGDIAINQHGGGIDACGEREAKSRFRRGVLDEDAIYDDIRGSVVGVARASGERCERIVSPVREDAI